MDAQHSQSLGQLLITGDNHASIPKSPEVLAGEKRKTAQGASRSARSALVIPRPDRLGGILDHRDAALCGNLQNGIQVKAAAEQMDRQDGLRPGSNLPRHGFRIQVNSGGVDVNKNGVSPNPSNHPDGGKEGVRSRKRIGPRRHADGKARSTQRGDFFLQRRDFRSQNEMLGLTDPVDRLTDFRPDRGVLRFQV